MRSLLLALLGMTLLVPDLKASEADLSVCDEVEKSAYAFNESLPHSFRPSVFGDHQPLVPGGGIECYITSGTSANHV